MAALLKIKRPTERFGPDTIEHVRLHATLDGFMALCRSPQGVPKGFMLYYAVLVNPHRLHPITRMTAFASVCVSTNSLMTDKLVSHGTIREVKHVNLSEAVSESLNQFAAMIGDTAITFIKAMEKVVRLGSDGWLVAMNGDTHSRQLNVSQCGALGRVLEFTGHTAPILKPEDSYNRSLLFERARDPDILRFEQKLRNVLARALG